MTTETINRAAVPTGVGVNRPDTAVSAKVSSRPHGRGGEPLALMRNIAEI